MNKEDYEISYDLGLDIAQKSTFFIIMMIAISNLKAPGIATVVIFAATLIARVLIFAPVQALLNGIFKDKEFKHPFLFISHKVWVAIVVIGVFAVTIIDFINQGDFFTVFLILIMNVVVISLYTKDAKVTVEPEKTDPNKKGTYMWKKVNGVEFVGYENAQVIHRDKNGNYYAGSNYVPIPAPVTIKKK